MPGLPRILIIDDRLGRGPDEPYRKSLCSALGLRDGEAGGPSGDEGFLADATFCAAQRFRDGWAINDPKEAIAKIRSGWPFNADGGRWALVCIDLNFVQGKGRQRTQEPFGIEILARVIADPDLWNPARGQVPVVMLSAEDPEKVEERALAKIRDWRGRPPAFFGKWVQEANGSLTEAKRDFAELLFSEGLVEDGALRVADRQGRIVRVPRDRPLPGSSCQLLAALRSLRACLISPASRPILLETRRGDDSSEAIQYLHDHRSAVMRHVRGGGGLPERPRYVTAAELDRGKLGTDTVVCASLQQWGDEDLRKLINFMELPIVAKKGIASSEPRLLNTSALVVATRRQDVGSGSVLLDDAVPRFDRLEWPSLRQRASDIPAMFHQELEDLDPAAARRWVIDAGARRALQDHPWPHEVHELEAVASRVALGARFRRSIDRAAIAAAIDHVKGVNGAGRGVHSLEDLLGLMREFEFSEADTEEAWPKMKAAFGALVYAMLERAEADAPLGRESLKKINVVGTRTSAVPNDRNATGNTQRFVRKWANELGFSGPLVDRLLRQRGSGD